MKVKACFAPATSRTGCALRDGVHGDDLLGLSWKGPSRQHRLLVVKNGHLREATKHHALRNLKKQQSTDATARYQDIVKQTKLIGVLYLENNLTSHVFASSRVAVLEMLASQAATSLENARLNSALEQEHLERKRAEAELRPGRSLNWPM